MKRIKFYKICFSLRNDNNNPKDRNEGDRQMVLIDRQIIDSQIPYRQILIDRKMEVQMIVERWIKDKQIKQIHCRQMVEGKQMPYRQMLGEVQTRDRERAE